MEQSVLHACPSFSKAISPPGVRIPDEISGKRLAFATPCILYVSPNNPGAEELAGELDEHYRSKGLRVRADTPA